MLLKLRDSEYLFSDMWFYYHEWYLKLMYNQIKVKENGKI